MTRRRKENDKNRGRIRKETRVTDQTKHNKQAPDTGNPTPSPSKSNNKKGHYYISQIQIENETANTRSNNKTKQTMENKSENPTKIQKLHIIQKEIIGSRIHVTPITTTDGSR